MNLLKCIIREEKLPDVLEKLSNIVPGLTVSEVRGYGRQRGHSAVYRGVEYVIDLVPKLMVEIVVENNRVDDVVKAVYDVASTGQIGDGRIFILPVEEAYHIRTGFMDR